MALEAGFSALGLAVTPRQTEQLLTYGELLLAQNRVMNLTAITQPLEVAKLHFIDSAALLSMEPLAGKSLIDVGTGAGFPGIVLKILEPTLQLTLLDSLQKRLFWLETVCGALELEGVTLLHRRAEEGGREEGLRDAFDVATARAVASLPQLAELCLPYVKPGGVFLAMKAGGDTQELEAAGAMIEKLGGGAPQARDYALPLSGAARRLVWVSKISPTPEGYPRKWAKIKGAKI